MPTTISIGIVGGGVSGTMFLHQIVELNKKNVYLFEINDVLANQAKLPYSTGLIWSYCRTIEDINSNYQLAKLFWWRDTTEKILSEISTNEKTTIVFESPHRFTKLLKELKEYCGGQREICVSRELTKKFEEQINNKIDRIIEIFENREIIGELTIVIKGLEKSNEIEFNKPKLKKELHELINAGLTLSAASKYLAKKKNLKKNLIYNLF